MLNAIRLLFALIALLSAALLFASLTLLLPAAEEELEWRAGAAQASTASMMAYLDSCRACLHDVAAEAAIDVFDQTVGRVSMLKLTRRDNSTERIARADLATDGLTVVSSAAWGAVSLWETRGGGHSLSIARASDDPEVRDVAMLSDSRRYAAISDARVSVWEPGREEPMRTLVLTTALNGEQAEVKQLSASPTAPDLAWVTDEGGTLWHTAGNDLSKLEHPDARLIGFAPPRHLVSVSGTEIRRWRSDIGEFDGGVAVRSEGYPLALSNDGRQVYFSAQQAVDVLDTTTGELLRKLPLGERQATGACSSSADTPVVIATDTGELLAFEAGTTELVATWRAHRAAVDLLRCANDSPYVLSVGASGTTAKLWDRPTVIMGMSQPPATAGHLGSGWAADTDWRAPWVDAMLRWRVLERVPSLPRWLEAYSDEVPILAVMGLIFSFLMLKVLWPAGPAARRRG